jgi:selenocysteine lyase/cysteine desulfurase
VKYLLASAGLAFVAYRPGLVTELLPTQTGWFADENVFDMQIARYRPHASARRFDAGTPPVPSIYAGVAGVGVVAEAGVPEIATHVRGLVERLAAGLRELGASVAAPPAGPLVCVRSTDAPALVAALAAEDIVTSERDSNLRVSLHLYNTEEDVDAVLAALARRRELLA